VLSSVLPVLCLFNPQSAGVSSIRYLTRWRMRHAQMELSERGTTVAEAGVRAGYATEAAFSRGFKRTLGYPTSAARSA